LKINPGESPEWQAPKGQIHISMIMWMKLSGIRTLGLFPLERRILNQDTAPMGQAVECNPRISQVNDRGA